MNRIFAYLLFVLALLASAFWLGRQSVRPVIETVETVRTDTIYQDRPVPVAVTNRPVTVNIPRVLFAGEHVKDSRKSFVDAGGYVKDSRKSFADADINQVAAADSVAVEIPIETRTYRDSLLTAQVSGPRLVFVRPDTIRIEANAGLPEVADGVAVAIEMQTLEYRDSAYYARVVGPKVGPYRPRLDCIETYNRTRTIRETVTKRNRFAVTAGAGVAYTPDGLQPTIGVQVGVILWGW